VRPSRALTRLLALAAVVAAVLGVAGPAYAADITRPTLDSVSLLGPSSVTTGDVVTVGWVAHDDVAVMQVQVNLQDSSGKNHTLWANSPATSGSVTIDASWANGPVQATYVWVYDVNGNFSVFNRNGTQGGSPSGGPTTHTVDITAADFTTHDIAADATPPTLSALSLVSPGPFTAGDTVSVSLSTSDDSGVGFVNLGFRDAVGKVHAFQASGHPSTVSRVIDASWANGPVQLFQVEVEDTAFNSSVYHRDGTVSYSAGVTGPATHTVDLSAGDFATHDTGADVTPPVLSSVTLDTPGPLVEGDAVQISFDASDASGVSQVALGLVDSANKAHYLFAMNGQSSATATIDDSWAVGTVRLEQARVYDTRENESDYYRNGTVSYTPPGSGSHTMDFDSVSFEVEGRPTVAVESAPPSSSSSSSAMFAFATTDRDTPADQLTAQCDVDSTARACTPAGGTFSSMSNGPHHLAVTVSDPQGHHSTASYSWSVDTDAPVARTTGPVPSSTLLAAVPLSWSGSDVGSGIGSYDLRYQTATATSGFTSWKYPAGWQHLATTQLTASLSPGGTLCFAVRARDNVGNVSPWTASRCVTRAYDDTLLRPSSGWSRVYLSSLYGGSALQTPRYGVTATTGTVTVRHLAVVATTCPSCGKVVVEINGHAVATLNLASTTTRRRVLLSVPLSSTWVGAVRLRVVSTNRAVEIDGLVLSRV